MPGDRRLARDRPQHRSIARELGRHGATALVNYRSSETAVHETADDGRFVNVSSVVGKRGNVEQANHAAAKSAGGLGVRIRGAEPVGSSRLRLVTARVLERKGS